MAVSLIVGVPKGPYPEFLVILLPERIFQSQFLKGNQASTWNQGEGWPRTVRKVETIDMLISFFLMIIQRSEDRNLAQLWFLFFYRIALHYLQVQS